MISLAYGLGASVCWAATTILLTLASARTSARDAALWFFAFGVLLSAPLGVAALGDVTTDQLLWVALAAVTSATAMLLLNRALARGQIGTVAPLTALEGPFAVLAGILSGQQVATAVIVGGLVATGGGVMIALRRGAAAPAAATGPPPGPAARVTAGSALAVGAAALFGVSLWALAQQDAPPVASVLLLRAIGLATIAPTIAHVRVRASSLPWLLAAALGDVAGNVLFLSAARADSLAVAAVAATQFGSLSAIGGFVIWHDRLTRRQLAGVVALGAGIAIVAASTA